MNAIESSGGASSSLSQSKGPVDEKAMKEKLIKNMAMDYNVSISASGGGKLGRRSNAKSRDSDDDYDESSAFPSESATISQSVDKFALLRQLTEKYKINQGA